LLDLCCGAGAHLARFSARVAPGGQALGVDFSEDAVARARAAGCEAVAGDATALPMVADAWATSANCAFGIYYLDDIDAALREWHRVLRPGGTLVISGPAEGTNAELYAFHERATGSGPSDADTLAVRVMASLGERLTAAGFSDVRTHELTNPVRFAPADFLAYWTSTSLFARTNGAREEQGRALAERGEIPDRVTKRVRIVIARREPA
jgi:ubiquinone/menaquinone biosynthesis C-methylase UbiE